MTLASFNEARSIAASCRDFDALIMAAIRTARGHHRDALAHAFPDQSAEFAYRYWSGGGLMPGEEGYDPEMDDNLRPVKS